LITSFRSKVFWIAALAMLLLTGMELIACEVISPETCEIAGAAGDQSPDSGDACLCCCPHVAIAAPMVLGRADEAVALDPPPSVAFPSFETASIFHPPKA
jgi:hypothetical protein